MKDRTAKEENPRKVEKQLKQLRQTIQRLERENTELSAALGRKATDAGGSTVDEASHLIRTRRLMRSGSYFSYMFSVISSSSPYRIWSRLLTYSRRFRLISVILRVAARIVAFVETSAALLLIASAAIILIPILLALTLISAAAALIEGGKKLRELSDALNGKQVYVFFPANRRQLKRGSFYSVTLRELAGDSDNAVFAVSPAFALLRDSSFLTVRRAGVRIYYIRRHFFFRLRRRVLTRIPQRVAYIY